MLEATRPLFLAAALAATIVPIALHFLRPREGVARPLPTARFLDGKPLLAPRFHRRPSHPWLLIVRLLFVILLGALFSGLRWLPGGERTGEVVVVDLGEGMGARAEGALSMGEARAAAVEPSLLVTVRGEPSFVELLEAGREGAGRLGTPGIRLTVVTRLREGSWTPELPGRRSELWPAALTLVETPHPEDAPRAEVSPPIRLHHAPGAGAPLALALRTLGVEGVELTEAEDPGLPWDPMVEWPGPEPRSLLLSDGSRVRGPWRPLPGAPYGADETPLLWEGGRPAGAVRRGAEGEPCRALFGVAWEEPGGLPDPEPEWVRGVLQLLEACVPLGERPGWDPGPTFRALLEGAELPREAELSQLAGVPAGRSLDRPLLLLLLLFAGVEVGMGRGRGRKRESGG